MPEGWYVRNRGADVSRVRNQDGPGIHAVSGSGAGERRFAGPCRDPGASATRDGAGRARVVNGRDFIVHSQRLRSNGPNESRNLRDLRLDRRTVRGPPTGAVARGAIVHAIIDV